MNLSKLKISIVLSKNEYLNWKYELIKELDKEKDIEVVSVVFIDKSRTYNFSQMINFLLGSIFKLCLIIERLVVGREIDYVKNLSEKLDCDFKSHNFKGKYSSNGEYIIPEKILNQLRGEDLDIILDLSYSRVFNKYSVSRLGIWYFKYSFLNDSYTYLFGFWEMLTKQGQIYGSLNINFNNKSIVLNDKYVSSSRVTR